MIWLLVILLLVSYYGLVIRELRHCREHDRSAEYERWGEMNITAIHEAGHMAVAQAAGWTVIHVTASGDEGATTFAPVEEPRTSDILDVLAAGAAAELVVFGEIVSTCAELAADILVFSTWNRFAARVQAVARTMDAEAVVALASEL